MFLSSYNIYPDLNYFSAPFCILTPMLIHQLEINNSIGIPTSSPYSQPPEKSLNIIQSNDIFSIQKNNNIQLLKGLKYSNLSQISTEKFEIISKKGIIASNSNHNKFRDLFYISNPENFSQNSTKSCSSSEKGEETPITNKLVIEFNNNPKLKKIHSAYHIKRKITTKFQNDIREYLNNLISKVNMKKLGYKLPFVVSNSKEYREDVKIESLRKYKDITIAKYIAEDVNNAGRSLNMENIALIDKIDKIYHNNAACYEIKEIYNVLNLTIVYDYYTNFLYSERFKKCFKKDIEKYCEKLLSLKFTKQKMELYKKIFKEKYEGIASSYFACE